MHFDFVFNEFGSSRTGSLITPIFRISFETVFSVGKMRVSAVRREEEEEEKGEEGR